MVDEKLAESRHQVVAKVEAPAFRLVRKGRSELLEEAVAAADHADAERRAFGVNAPDRHRAIQKIVAVALAENAHEQVVVLESHELGVESAYRIKGRAADQRRRGQHEHVV